ncbi:MAG: DNA repair protein RecN [bacterium]|nr:DNA repair protein RecN [bacterium]
MLCELEIADFKLLHDTRLTFGPGMTAITGETGVGKSMLLGALGFLLGEKVGEDVFAQATGEVKVLGTFLLDPARPEVQSLIAAGIWEPEEEGEFLLERSVVRGGRSRVFLNGRRISLGVLQQISEALMDLLGQNQVRYLTRIDPATLLDSLGDPEHRAACLAMEQAFRTLKKARSALAAAEQQRAAALERHSFLEFQHQELTIAQLMPDEEARLNQEQQRLASIAELRQAAGEAATLLQESAPESPAVYDQLAAVLERVELLADLDADWAVCREQLAGMLEQLQEWGRQLLHYSEQLEGDPERLHRVDRRLAQLEQLKRKYRLDFAGLLALRDQVATDLELIEGGEEQMALLQQEVAQAESTARQAAALLHARRIALAPLVEARLLGHLKDLNLAHARVEFRIEADPSALGASGSDHVDLLLATAPREALQPFQQIASGGEVTRLALAFKALQAFPPLQSLMVVDEGDLGIGGDTAFQVGAKFRELSQWQQVLIVSHLPQVAACAAQHLAVRRDLAGDRITIVPVEGDARVAELARMLGDRIDQSAARELASSYLREATGVASG